MPQADISLYQTLLRDGTPLLDVRAPIEFHKGAFPNAHNIPLLEDSERSAVGTAYKRSGQQAAIALGNQLVCGASKEARLDAWATWLKANPDAWLYCFRGGLRSNTVQRWLADAGVHCPLVPGGYKAMRQLLIDTIDNASAKFPLIIIAGPTGSGKTHLLNSLERSLDLEGFAHHRGSAFGRQLGGQPTQINFENSLAIRLLNLQQFAGKSLFIEDESQAIGSLSVPFHLHSAMKQAPIALIEEDSDFRTQTILNDYIRDNLKAFEKADPESAFENFAQYLRAALAKIQKRLGGERYEQIKSLMEQALAVQRRDGDTQEHAFWIEKLLTNYYDPMYSYQLSKRRERLIFKGNSDEFLAWATQIQ